MSTVTVLHASAVIAFLQHESGHEVVEQALQNDQCMVSAANQAEIISKALDRGVSPEAIVAILAELSYVVLDITAADGVRAGMMRLSTRSAGLSLGDRLCLATAKRLEAHVMTADRAWLSVAQTLGLGICCIRTEAH